MSTELPKPTDAPDFDVNLTNADPIGGTLVSDGYIIDQIPTSGNFNWFWNVIGRWINWLSGNPAWGIGRDSFKYYHKLDPSYSGRTWD